MQSTAMLTRDTVAPQRTLGRADAVDYLRGLAAVLVVLYHANGAFWRYGQMIPLNGRVTEFLHVTPLAGIVGYVLFGFGFLGVQLFFVISGFCIHLPVATRNREFDYRGFLIRRFFRLYPLYLAVVLVCFLLEGMLRGFGHEPATIRNLVGHLFLWPYCVPRDVVPMGIVPVLWTLTIEAHFYVLYMLLYPLLKRVGIARLAVIGLLIDVGYRCAWGAFGPQVSVWPRIFSPEYFAVTRFGEWLLGAWLAEYFVALPHKTTPTHKTAWRNVLMALMGLVASAGLAVAWSDRFLSPMACVCFALLLRELLTLQSLVPIDSLRSYGLLHHIGLGLGERSYSLYLVHFTCITVATTVLSRYLAPSDKSAIVGTPSLLVAIMAGLVITAGATELAYRFVERPSHRLARHLASNSRTSSSLRQAR